MASWKKGKSGNPSGRPKDVEKIGALARTHTREAFDRLLYWMRSDNGRVSSAAAVAILDRGWGKPKQTVVTEGEDGKERPLGVIVVPAKADA